MLMALQGHLLQVEELFVDIVMARAYSYVVKRDYGFAPNPFYGVLTLATCKQDIRKSAKPGDYIIGNATTTDDNKLVYMAKVSEVMSFDEYWNSKRFQMKKPIMNGSLKKLYGDNIYHHDSEGKWIQDDSHHANDDGSTNKYNLKRDTSTSDNVLICQEFFYFGKSMFLVPEEFSICIHSGIGYHCPKIEYVELLWAYLKDNYPGGGRLDDPLLFKDFKRYDGQS